MQGYETFPTRLINGYNKNCFECKTKNVMWASVSMGIFLCTNCAGDHRGFGVHISFVRSQTLDKWSEDQIKVMEISGNERLKTFFMCYNIKIQPGAFKYQTKAAQYYRDLLQYESGLSLDKPTKIENEEAAEKMESGNAYEKKNYDLDISFAEGENPFTSDKRINTRKDEEKILCEGCTIF